MHVTACLAGQKVDVEVGEDCRTLQALRESIVKELPQLCVEGFDVSVGGRALDNDEGIVSLEEGVGLDVVPNSRGLGVLALREAGREVSKAGLLQAAIEGDVSLVTLYLDAGLDAAAFSVTPLHYACRYGHLEVATLLLDRGSTAIDAKDNNRGTPLHYACLNGNLEVATRLLDRGSTAIDAKDNDRETPLHDACLNGHLEVATLLLDRGSTAIDEEGDCRCTPLHYACCNGHLEVATLLLDRGSNAIDAKDNDRDTPLHLACCKGHVEVARLLLDREACSVEVEKHRSGTFGSCPYPQEVLDLLSERGHDAVPVESAKRRRTV